MPSTVPKANEDASVDVKKPKRLLHFSDGVLEEFTDDDEVDLAPPNEKAEIIDYKTMSWGPWLGNKVSSAGSSALAVCDYLGENLAYFFGITTPKYWYEIEEYKRQKALELEQQQKTEGWSEPAATNAIQLDHIDKEPVFPV